MSLTVFCYCFSFSYFHTQKKMNFVFHCSWDLNTVSKFRQSSGAHVGMFDKAMKEKKEKEKTGAYGIGFLFVNVKATMNLCVGVVSSNVEAHFLLSSFIVVRRK